MNDHPDPRRHLTVTQAAAAMRVCAETIRLLYDEGKLKGFRSATGRRYIDATSIPPQQSLTVSEAARVIGRSADTIRDWFDAGRLAGHRSPGGHRRIDPASLSAIAAEGP